MERYKSHSYRIGNINYVRFILSFCIFSNNLIYSVKSKCNAQRDFALSLPRELMCVSCLPDVTSGSSDWSIQKYKLKDKLHSGFSLTYNIGI